MDFKDGSYFLSTSFWSANFSSTLIWVSYNNKGRAKWQMSCTLTHKISLGSNIEDQSFFSGIFDPGLKIRDSTIPRCTLQRPINRYQLSYAKHAQKIRVSFFIFLVEEDQSSNLVKYQILTRLFFFFWVINKCYLLIKPSFVWRFCLIKLVLTFVILDPDLPKFNLGLWACLKEM